MKCSASQSLRFTWHDKGLLPEDWRYIEKKQHITCMFVSTGLTLSGYFIFCVSTQKSKWFLPYGKRGKAKRSKNYIVSPHAQISTLLVRPLMLAKPIRHDLIEIICMHGITVVATRILDFPLPDEFCRKSQGISQKAKLIQPRNDTIQA